MKELGAWLKGVREEKNISIEDLQKETKIRKTYLVAIEEGNEDRLPGEVYLKGFLRNYALAIGLDPAEVMAKYKKIRSNDLEEEKEELEEIFHERKEGLTPITIHLLIILAIAVLLLFSIFNIMRLNSDDEDREVGLGYTEELEERDNDEDRDIVQELEDEVEDREMIEEVEEEEEEDTLLSQEEVTHTRRETVFLPFLKDGSFYLSKERLLRDLHSLSDEEPQPIEDLSTLFREVEEVVEGVVVDIKANERSWLRVRINGEEEFQGFIEEGETMYFEGEEEIHIRIGNAGGVFLKDERGEYSISLGVRGEVKDLLFTPGEMDL